MVQNWQETIRNGAEWLRGVLRQVSRAHLFTHEGRSYLYNDNVSQYGEMSEPRDLAEHAPDVAVLDVDSLAVWAHAMDGEMDHGGRKTRGQITVSRKGTTWARTPIFIGPDTERETASKPFFMGFMPAESFAHTFGYVSFLTWLELLGPSRLEGYDACMVAFKSVTASEGEVTKVSTEGAYLTVHTEDSKGVKGAAKAPKVLNAVIPFGDPGCVTNVRFRLSITHDRGALRFSVEHVSTDGAFDVYVAWMLEALTGTDSANLAPAGWAILAAP